MDKVTAIRIIEIDEAIHQLQLLFEIHINSETYSYITDKINQLLTEKQTFI